jgi:hypothetical protein
LIVALGYAALVPATGYYVPLAPGIANRINVVAALGYALIVLAAAKLLATLTCGSLRRPRAPIGVLSGLLVLAVLVGYDGRVERDARAWSRAAAIQRRILGTLRAHLRPPRRGTTIVTVGAPIETAPGVVVFSEAWDLQSAVRLMFNDLTLRGYPLAPAQWVWCGRGHLWTTPATQGPTWWQANYPVEFVDVRKSTFYAVTTRGACRRATARLELHPPANWRDLIPVVSRRS